MVTAFVLINIDDKDLKKISEKLLDLPGIKEVHLVAGEYDIVAVIRVKDNQSLSDIITDKILHVPGILRTKTLFSLDTFARCDLKAMFKV